MSSQLKQSLKLPGASKIRGKEPPPPSSSSSPITTIDAKLLEGILTKASTFIDLSSNAYNLESDDFLLHCPNVIKELDLSFNSLIQLSSLKNLHKLKRLFVDNNVLVSFPFHGLSNLVMLSAQNNRLVTIEDTGDMKKLVHLDLCGNRIVQGFEELAKLKTLRVLDLASNTLDMPIQNFTAFVLEPLKRLPKLEYVSFADNPIATKIPEFRCFVIQELPRLKYLDWLPITKEERVKAGKLESESVWAAKTLPPQDTPSPRVGSSTSITHNSSKDAALEPAKNIPAGEPPKSGNTGGAAEGGPGVTSPLKGLATSASAPSPIPVRNNPVPYRESSQFNDFSALDAMIEEFEGASHELMLSRSVSSPPPASVKSPVNRSNASFDAGIANISDIPDTSVKSAAQEDTLAELLTEFESITPAAPSHGASDDASPVSPIHAASRPTNAQFTDALAMNDVNYPDHSYEKYPEDAQILSNIDKAIESTPKQKKFATNVVHSDFPDAYFADELEAALGELEASLDFPESHDHPDNNTQNNYNNRSYTISSLSEIESTLQELAGTSASSTPSKTDSTIENGSPYTTPTHNKSNTSDSNNLNKSVNSPYGTNFSSNSNRTNTPLPSQPKPPVQRTQSELPKTSPKLATPAPTSTLKKTTPLKPAASPSSNNASFSHSFAASFDSSNPSSPTSPAAAAIPDSPKIRSKNLPHSFEEPVIEPHPEEILQEEEDVLDELISSLALEGPLGQEDEDSQVPTMLRPRRPLSAVFVHPVSQPALSTLPSPAQLPQSIIKQQELQQQQQMLLHQQERERRINVERQRQMQEEHEQQQRTMRLKLSQQQQQMEQLQQQQAERERKLQEERERERLQREQLEYREQVLQRELQQQKELQIQKELQMQTEMRKKEMQAEALLQQQKQQAIFLQQQAIAQKQQQDELTAEIEAARKLQQEEERGRLINMTAQLIPYNFLTITDKIGGGAFGDVHKCVMRYPPTANLAPKDVTVKKIRMQRFNDNFLDQFSKEVQSFSALSPHPNIVPLIGGCIEVVICTIHDYVSGISLAETKGIQELGSSLTLQIARSVIVGLQELHKCGKMHRSLKPSNVMLANPDETTPLRTVKLRDYGFVAIKDAILKAGQAPNPYLAPEIITSTSPPSYTQAVDTFAFGMTLWFMFSGEQPFPGLHPKKMTESLASGVRPNIPPHTPTALAKLIAACWNTEPTARPPLDTVARILNMSEAKLFAGAAPIANPPQPQHPQPPQHQPPQSPKPQSQPPLPTPSPQLPRQQRTTPLPEAQGSRISTVLSRVVDTLISKAQNQIPKACRLLEVINQPDVIPVMVEKAIPKYLVDMLKNTQADSNDIEAVLRTLQILSDHEIFARSLCSLETIAPILALVRSHTAVANISRGSSYAIRNNYVLPAARVVHVIIAHPALLAVLRDSAEMETLITFTDSLKDSQNQVANQSNDEATTQILGVLYQLLSAPKARNYFVNASGLDAVLFHANSSYPPLRGHVVEVLFLFTVHPPSPQNLLQDGFVRNPAAVISLVSCVSNSTDTSQLRRQASKVISALAQLPWQSSGTSASSGGSTRSTSSAGSSRSSSLLTNTAVIASLQATVPKLISTVGSCKAGDNDELVLDICTALSSILDNPNLNASGSISKLDQLAIFAQLQHIPQSSPILLPLLHLANRIVHLRSDDTANLHGELAMCVPQLISIACSTSLPLEVKTQALDFIAHIATDSQHALTLIEAGLLQPLMQQLTHSAKDPSTAFSLQIIASILGSLFQDRLPSFASVCATIVEANGITSISRFVQASKETSLKNSEHSDMENACEWAVAALSELAHDEVTRTAMLAAGSLALLVGTSSQKNVSDRVAEGTLAYLSSFCASPKYFQSLKDTNAMAMIISHLSSSDTVVPLALKCVLQLVKEPAGRELLVAHNVISKLEMIAQSTESKNPTLPLAAKKVLSLLKT